MPGIGGESFRERRALGFGYGRGLFWSPRELMTSLLTISCWSQGVSGSWLCGPLAATPWCVL